jgi:hypothetical protein
VTPAVLEVFKDRSSCPFLRHCINSKTPLKGLLKQFNWVARHARTGSVLEDGGSTLATVRENAAGESNDYTDVLMRAVRISVDSLEGLMRMLAALGC